MKTLKLWCCVGYGFKKPVYDHSSLSYSKKGSISGFMSNGFQDWPYWKKRGWTCEKVEVTITPLNKQSPKDGNP